MKRKNSRTAAILIAALVIALLTGAVTLMSHGTPVLQNAVSTFMTPLRGAAASLTRQAERIYNYIYGYETLEAENRMLQQRIADMERENAKAEELQRENDRLTQLLKLSEEHEDYQFTAADLISRSGSTWGSDFTISRGENAGIETGMAVVTEYGQMLGLVSEVGSNWATVTTIMDQGSQLSAMLAQSGYTGIIRGMYQSGSELLRMEYLPTDSVIRNNELVVTTGTTRYPSGLTIGYISDAGLDESGIAKYAEVTPSADFSTLEQVFIITEYTLE